MFRRIGRGARGACVTRCARVVMVLLIGLHAGAFAGASAGASAAMAQGDALPTGVPKGAKKATVAQIEDGDKLSVYLGKVLKTVLLSGIDAPEKGECFFKESTENLAKLLPEGTEIYLQSSGDDKDGKGRLLRYVWLPSTSGGKAALINTKLVRDGFAGFDGSKDSPKYYDRLKELQKDAKSAGKGLWGACGGVHVKPGGSQAGSSQQSSGSSGSSGSSAPKKGERCLDVSAEVQQAITEGLTAGTGATLRGFQAVRSKDYEQVFFVAADLEGPGLDGDDQIGIWATNIIDSYGGIYLSVDGMAKQFSDYPDGDSTDAYVTINDDGAKAAKDCTKAVLKGA